MWATSSSGPETRLSCGDDRQPQKNGQNSLLVMSPYARSQSTTVLKPNPVATIRILDGAYAGKSSRRRHVDYVVLYTVQFFHIKRRSIAPGLLALSEKTNRGQGCSERGQLKKIINCTSRIFCRIEDAECTHWKRCFPSEFSELFSNGMAIILGIMTVRLLCAHFGETILYRFSSITSFRIGPL